VGGSPELLQTGVVLCRRLTHLGLLAVRCAARQHTLHLICLHIFFTQFGFIAPTYLDSATYAD
jgi:hypothetical protein